MAFLSNRRKLFFDAKKTLYYIRYSTTGGEVVDRIAVESKKSGSLFPPPGKKDPPAGMETGK